MAEHVVYLKNTTNGHNKHYFVAVVHDAGTDDWVVHTAYGRIGAKPVENECALYGARVPAMRAAMDIVSEKKAKGYVVILDAKRAVQPIPPWFRATLGAFSPVPVLASAESINPPPPTPRRKPRSIQAVFEKRKRTAQWRF